MYESYLGSFLVAHRVTIHPLSHPQGRSVHTYNMLVEARGMCNPLRSSEHVYDTLTNKLVYVSGKLSTVEVCV